MTRPTRAIESPKGFGAMLYFIHAAISRLDGLRGDGPGSSATHHLSRRGSRLTVGSRFRFGTFRLGCQHGEWR